MSKLELDVNKCLSLDVMRMYQERKLPGKDMHHVEKHLLDCELCSDVIEGLQANDIPAIRSIASNVDNKITAFMGPPAAPSYMKRMGWYFAVPLILLLGWFTFSKLTGEAPVIVAPAPVAQKPSTGNNGPAPVKTAPVIEQPVRTPQGVEKQVTVPTQIAEKQPAENKTAPGSEKISGTNTVPATEESKGSPVITETAKNEETPPHIDEKPLVKPPPAEDYANLRIIEVKVINKVTAPSGKKSSGSSKGQLGSKSGRSDDAVFMPDEMPVFYGGDEEMKYWLVRNFKNPVKDKRELKGKTTSVIFNVSSRGNVSEVTIGKSLSPELDAEVIRLIESMPQWRAAAKKGTIQCILAITFK